MTGRSERIDSFSEWLADAYVNWSLFLSSYSPLLGIFAIRLSEKHPGRAVGIALLAFIFAVNVALLLRRRLGTRDFHIESLTSGAGELTAYIATYLLPFLVVSDVGWRDLVSYALLIFIIGLVSTREGLLHINPLLAIFRWRVSTITTADGATYYLLSRRRVGAGTVVRSVILSRRLIMEKHER